MKEIEVYVHTAHNREPQLLSVSEGLTIEELLHRVAPDNHHELVLIVEDEEEPREHHHKLHEAHIHHRHHVHCHQCRRAEVTVSFNGTAHAHGFSPAATVEKVLRWALHAFGLKGQDAMNKVLRAAEGSSDPLPDTAHIGSFVHPGHCAVRLNLTDKVNVNG